MESRPALIVFARSPSPGATKTRLVPRLGAEGAADLYRCFLLDSLARACSQRADVIVAVAGETPLDAMRSLVGEVCETCDFWPQRGGNLGERMEQAFRQAFDRGYTSAVLIGTDSPSLPYGRLAAALNLSASRDMVLGPALDGGYYLMGLRRLLPGIFKDIQWGTDTVLAESLRRARASRCQVSLLDPWYDVDTPEDLQMLRRHLTALHLAGQPIPCPRTWEFIRRLPERD
jgi:hypothetical protein